MTITRLRARLGRRDWCTRFGSLSLSSKRFVSNCKRVTSAVAETCVLTNVNPTQPRSHSGDNIFFLFFFSGIQSICPHLVIILFRSTATFASNNLHQFKGQLKIVVSLCHITQPPSDSFSGDKSILLTKYGVAKYQQMIAIFYFFSPLQIGRGFFFKFSFYILQNEPPDDRELQLRLNIRRSVLKPNCFGFYWFALHITTTEPFIFMCNIPTEFSVST